MYLCHQDANNYTQLVQRAEGSADSGGRDLANVHGRQTRAQTAEHADDEPADDDHLKRLTQSRQSHHTATQ